MRISLENLSCPRLALDIVDASGSPRVIALDHLSHVSGTIEREGDRLRLMPLRVREVQVIGLEWLLPHGRIAIGTPATLAELAIAADLVVTAGGVPSMPTVAGTASLGLADAEDLTMVVAGQRISCDARLERLAVHLPAPGSAGTATIGALALRNLQTVLGKLFVRAGGIATDNASISWRPAATTGAITDSTITSATGHIEAGADSLLIFDLTISGQGIELHADRIEVSGGITRDRHDLHIGQVTISNATIRVDDISSFLPAMSSAAPAASPAAPAASPAAPAASVPTGAAQRPLIDLGMLDRVSGTVAVDTTVIADVPVLGRRRAVHSFRVPVDSGAFSYRQLEAGLASLEDWVIKFRVRAGMLVVERDLVVSRRDLVRWRLDEEALALAQSKDKRVRLRTMLDYELAIELTSPSAIELRDIDANPIVITLSIAAGDTPAGQSPSAISDVSAERIELSGSLRYPHDSEQALELCAQGIAFSLFELATSAVDICSGHVSIERVAGLRLDFIGLTPRSLAATLTGVRLNNWHIRLRPD